LKQISKNKPNSYFEILNCPLKKTHYLWLLATVQKNRKIHFFFDCYFGKSNPRNGRIEVLTLPSGTPYKIQDESLPADILKYIEPKTVPKINKRPPNCWKIWNSKYVTELNENQSINRVFFLKKKIIHQCLIRCVDETIEFIPTEPLVWKSYSKKNKLDLVIKKHLSKK
jgi:hypothetical protein